MLELRPYQPGDAKAVLSWIDSELTFYRWSAGRYGTYPIGPEVLEQAYAACGADGPYPLILVDDGVPVGHILLRYPDADHRTVRFGFVLLDSTKRGKGYGHQMLTLALAHAFDHLGAARVTIGVFEDNEPARRCYRRVGFHELPGQEERYRILDQDWLCIEMEITAPCPNRPAP